MEEDFQHPEVLEESTPEFLSNALNEGSNYFVQYGWFVLVAVMALFYFRPRLEELFYNYYDAKEERDFTAKCKKDPDFLRERQKGIDAARERMQAELDRKAQEHAAKQKELEEKKRQELIQSNEGVGGNTLGYTSQASKKNNYRPEYHPLMGSGGSGGYRPQRRSCCPSSGGCG